MPRADAVTAAGGGPGGAPAGDLVDRLVAEGMSRLSAERAVAIRAGAEPSRARRHGRSGW